MLKRGKWVQKNGKKAEKQHLSNVKAKKREFIEKQKYKNGYKTVFCTFAFRSTNVKKQELSKMKTGKQLLLTVLPFFNCANENTGVNGFFRIHCR